MEEGFSLARIAAQVRKAIGTEKGSQTAVSREPLACVLSDYCAARGIDQAQLMTELGIDPTHPLAEERFRRLAMVTVDKDALARVLLSGGPKHEDKDVA